MSDLVVIPTDMPLHLQTAANAGNALAENADFLDGISLGAPPALRLKGTRFELRESDGATRVIEEIRINVVVVAGRPGALKKTFYLESYDPNSGETKAPDCHSDDGIRPNQGCSLPQAEACAGCHQNVFGTAKNDAGQFTDGKACRDFKVLAVLYEGKIYEFDLPPASLKKFGAFAKALSDRGIEVYKVATTLGFDPEVVYPKVTFNFGGWLDEVLIGQIEGLRESAEVTDIIEPRQQAAQPALAAPVAQAQVAAPVEPVAPVQPAAPVVPAPVVEPVAPAQVLTPEVLAPVAAVVPAPVVAPIIEEAVIVAPIAPVVVAPVVAAPVAPVVAAPVAPVVAAPVAPVVAPTAGGGPDSRGVIWASGHHAENKAQNQAGEWKARRNCDKAALAAYEAQFAAPVAAAPVAAAPVAAAPVAAAPVAAAPIAAQPVAPLVAPVAAAPLAAPVAAQPATATDAQLRADLGL